MPALRPAARSRTRDRGARPARAAAILADAFEASLFAGEAAAGLEPHGGRGSCAPVEARPDYLAELALAEALSSTASRTRARPFRARARALRERPDVRSYPRLTTRAAIALAWLERWPRRGARRARGRGGARARRGRRAPVLAVHRRVGGPARRCLAGRVATGERGDRARAHARPDDDGGAVPPGARDVRRRPRRRGRVQRVHGAGDGPRTGTPRATSRRSGRSSARSRSGSGGWSEALVRAGASAERFEPSSCASTSSSRARTSSRRSPAWAGLTTPRCGAAHVRRGRTRGPARRSPRAAAGWSRTTARSRPLRRSLALHPDDEDVYGKARTQLCFGERLRRARRRTEAREQLRAALEAFERLGAARGPSGRARSCAPPARPRASRDPSTLDQLTPQELQVSRLVATA